MTAWSRCETVVEADKVARQLQEIEKAGEAIREERFYFRPAAGDPAEETSPVRLDRIVKVAKC
jgi:hypothetical protein